MASIEYITLYIILFISFIWLSFKSFNVSSDKKFWRLALIPILIFVFNEGMRYGRGVDYEHYKNLFDFLNHNDSPQIVFYYLMDFIKAIGGNYVVAFIAYATIFIVGSLSFIRKSFDYKEIGYAYVFVLFSMLTTSESLIRQYVAIPVALVSISLFLNKKWAWAAAFALISINIHSVVLLLLVAVVIAYLVKDKILNGYVVFALLFVTYYLLPHDYLIENINPIVNVAAIYAPSFFEGYFDNSDRWFGADSYIEGFDQTTLTMTLSFIRDASIVLIGYIAVKNKPNSKINIFYNISAIGLILLRGFFGMELIYRTVALFANMWFIPCAYGFYILSKKSGLKISSRMSLVGNISKVAFILYMATYFGRFIFFAKNYDYVWDKF